VREANYDFSNVTGSFIYPIVDTAVCGARGLDPVRLAEACFRGGARLVQLRAKEGSSAAVLTLADDTIAAARTFGARVIVNDRADIALMAGAEGVHVGQEDLSVDAVRAIVGASRIVGVSSHTREQIDRALQTTADYVAVGPIFETSTKATGYSARGLDLIAYAAGRGKPIVAIGGITLDRAADVIAAGASGLAVITDLLTSGDAEGRVREFLRELTVPREP
jgi:thiamine-phosphate pyrophosphorylase